MNVLVATTLRCRLGVIYTEPPQITGKSFTTYRICNSEATTIIYMAKIWPFILFQGTKSDVLQMSFYSITLNLYSNQVVPPHSVLLTFLCCPMSKNLNK